MLSNSSGVRSANFFMFSHSIHVFCDVILSRRVIDYRDFIVTFGRSQRQRQGGGQQREALCRCVADNKRGSAIGGLLNCRPRNTSFLPGILSTMPKYSGLLQRSSCNIHHEEMGKSGSSGLVETFLLETPTQLFSTLCSF